MQNLQKIAIFPFYVNDLINFYELRRIIGVLAIY